jgi:hypothetical protein
LPKRVPVALILLASWTLCALCFACWRIPYDDEWFSLELAQSRDHDAVLYALAHDLHPPYMALIDRALAALGVGRFGLQALRVLATSWALALLGAALQRELRARPAQIVLAAFHPVVFYYAGALRWYPLLLLAHALRIYALTRFTIRPRANDACACDATRSASPSPRSITMAFVTFIAGVGVGALASYVDGLFALYDLSWATLILVRGKRWRSAVALYLGALSIAVCALLASPLGAAHALRPLPPAWNPLTAGGWLWLGLTGEAGLSGAFALFGLCVVVWLAYAFYLALHEPRSRVATLWLLGYGLLWFVCAGAGAAHPRYSLALWLLLTWLGVRLWERDGWARVLTSSAACVLALQFALMLGAHSFWKSDLNELESQDCAELARFADSDLWVVPYARLTALIARRCKLQAPLLLLGSSHLLRSADTQLSELRERLPKLHRPILLSVQARSSISDGQERARALLRASCRAESTHGFGEVPHLAWKQRLQSEVVAQRFSIEPFSCDHPR